MVIFVLSFVGIVVLAGLAFGVVVGRKSKARLALSGVVLVAILSWAAVYNLGVNLGQIASLVSDATPFRTTASDIGGAKAMAQVTMYAAIIAYGVGCVVGLIRQNKRNADAPAD